MACTLSVYPLYLYLAYLCLYTVLSYVENFNVSVPVVYVLRHFLDVFWWKAELDAKYLKNAVNPHLCQNCLYNVKSSLCNFGCYLLTPRDSQQQSNLVLTVMPERALEVYFSLFQLPTSIWPGSDEG